MNTETWRDVPGLPHFQVSDLGNVRSMNRVIVDATGRRRTLKGRTLHSHPAGRGLRYLHIGLACTGGRTYFSVHRLVMLAFVGPPPPNHQVHHINGDARDNRLVNLEYRGTFAHISGHHAGVRNVNAKLDPDAVQVIRKLHLEGCAGTALARRFNVTPGTVYHIVHRRTWRQEVTP